MEAPHKAVEFIIKNAPKYAKAKSERVYLEEFRKSKKALLMKDALARGIEAANAQEREAYADIEYQELLTGLALQRMALSCEGGIQVAGNHEHTKQDHALVGEGGHAAHQARGPNRVLGHVCRRGFGRLGRGGRFVHGAHLTVQQRRADAGIGPTAAAQGVPPVGTVVAPPGAVGA